jgi:hypothetical protein
MSLRVVLGQGLLLGLAGLLIALCALCLYLMYVLARVVHVLKGRPSFPEVARDGLGRPLKERL